MIKVENDVDCAAHFHKANIQFFSRIATPQISPDVHIIVFNNTRDHVSCRNTFCSLCRYKPTI